MQTRSSFYILVLESSVMVHFSHFCSVLFAFSIGHPIGGLEFSLGLYGTDFQS